MSAVFSSWEGILPKLDPSTVICPTQPPQKPAPFTRSGRSHAIRFFAGFVALLTTYYIVISQPAADLHVMMPVLASSARNACRLINIFGGSTTVDGVVVRGSEYAIAVRRGCDPLDPLALFSSAILAFPTRWPRKIIGLLAGVVAIFMVNLLRLTSLYFLGAAKSPLFGPAHQEIWPALFILFSLGLWLAWLAWAQPSRTAENTAS